jgi:hypothetical protein
MLWKTKPKHLHMFKVPEALNTTATESVQSSETTLRGQGKSDFPASMVCNLAEASAFCEGYPQAVRLAESLGRKLPVARDYSLAEVFAGHNTDEIDRPHIGFAAQPDRLTT